MKFLQKIQRAMHQNQSLVCVGLDPLPALFPATLQKNSQMLLTFCKAIIDATADLVCAFKPQLAHFHALSAEATLVEIIAYVHKTYPLIPVILDGKRGDIGSTAQRYAEEAFGRYDADAVTVNPYMGVDAVAPFSRYADKGVFVICRTSNTSAGVVQDQQVGAEKLYEKIARLAAFEWNTEDNVFLVVGAQCSEHVQAVREIVGDLLLLVPGLGAQGGDMPAVVRAGLDSTGAGMILNSSRAILYASQGADFAAAARAKAHVFRAQINRFRSSCCA